MEQTKFVLLADHIPDVILDMHYYSTYNFVGARIDGYEEPVAILTREAADALKEASDHLVTLDYRLKIFDAYRPQRAVNHFVRWAEDLEDTKMKTALYHMGYVLNKRGKNNSSLYKHHPMWEAYDRDGLDLMIITSPSWYGKPEGKKLIMPIFDIMHRYIDFEEVGGGDIGKRVLTVVHRVRRVVVLFEYFDDRPRERLLVFRK